MPRSISESSSASASRKQTLQPGERRQMPVVFVVDASLPADVATITLSYTFFEVEGADKS